MIEETKKDFARWGQFFSTSIDGLSRGWNAFEGWWDNIVDTVHTGVNRYIQNSTEGIARAATEIQAGATALFNAGVELVQSLWDGAVAKFNEFLSWLVTIPSRIREAIGNIDLSNIIKWPSWGGSEAAPAATSTPAISGARAAGGPVNRGLTYLVGEQGPELFTPNRSGNIVPNHQLGGGGGGASVVFHNVFHIQGGGDKSGVESALRSLETQLSRSAQIAFGSASTA